MPWYSQAISHGLSGDAPREELVAQDACPAAGVADVAEDARREHDSRRAVHALLLVGVERGVVVVAVARDLRREHHRVLDRHARALREVLQGGMSRVSEQGDVASGPVGHRVAVVQHPVAVARDIAQHVAHPRRALGEDFLQLVGAAELRPRRA